LLKIAWQLLSGDGTDPITVVPAQIIGVFLENDHHLDESRYSQGVEAVGQRDGV